MGSSPTATRSRPLAARCGARAGEAGFSSIDLIVAITIMALALSAAIPGVREFLHNYYRNGATRQLMADIRSAQSLAVSRGGVFALQWGPNASLAATQYRIVKDAGACTLPATAAAKDNATVIQSWTNLAQAYPGMTIQSITDAGSTALSHVMFKSTGASVNTCATVSFPITVTLADRWGSTRRIEIRSAGMVRLL